MSYNSYRSTNRDKQKLDFKEKAHKYSKTEEIVGLLIIKFMKKYGIKT
jgi:hypothetical protein